MDEFIKKALKEGKIKSYRKAKYTDPALLEYDMPEFYIGEVVTKYNKYKIGDIVYVSSYYYKDKSKGSNHFFVIVDEDNYAVPITYFGMLLSKPKIKDEVCIGRVDKKLVDKFIKYYKGEYN